MRYRAEGITDTGLTRQNNEDAYLIDDETRLFLVSDGMGGHQAGEVASQLAVEVIQKYFSRKKSKKQNNADAETISETGKTDQVSFLAAELSKSIGYANRVIYQVGEGDIKYRGMGCTIAALVLVDPDSAIIANVGDSRIYLMRNNGLEQLNEDHTLLNEYLKNDPDFMNTKEDYVASHLDHILVRALGIDEDLEVDVRQIKLKEGDRFILCSDGLTDMLSDPEILEVARSEKKLDKLCSKLVALANEKGGLDNITVVVVDIEEL